MFSLNIVLLVSSLVLLIGCTEMVYEVKEPPCFCSHGGLCVMEEKKGQVCNCTEGFIGRACQQAALQLLPSMPAQDISDTYSYYYYTFTNPSAYLLRLNFTSQQSQPLTFEIGVKLQLGNNQYLENDDAYKRIQYSTKLHPHRSIQGILLLNQFFTEGVSSLRLILRIRTLKDSSLKEGLVIQAKSVQKINISSEITNLLAYNQQEIYYFFIFSSISTVVLFIITFFICNFIIRIRPRRHNQATLAQPFNNITHFDDQFPAFVYQNQPCGDNQEEDSNQCMICLLPIHQTLIRVTSCQHYFHKECIDEWGVKSLTCPTCRKSLAISGGNGNRGQPSADVELSYNFD